MRAKGNEEHLFLDLHEKAGLALSDNRTVTIAMKADSPNSAENIAKRQKFGKEKRVSVAALARIRKKYAEIFWNMPEVSKAFQRLSRIEQQHILAELPDKNHTALEAK